MKSIIHILLIVLMISCNRSTQKPKSIVLITSAGKQDSLFQSLVYITNNAIPETTLKDSMAFLVLPLQASCPSCRRKTIDSIVKYQSNLASNHFIILSANGGRKAISAFFREHDKELPVMPNRLFLDSTNQADKYELYNKNPAMYYSYNRKVYKKVAAIPETVKQDLQEFFLGWRKDN